MSEPVSEPGADAPEELPVIEFSAGLVGFPEYRRFMLVRVVDDGSLCVLRSLEDDDLRFVVVPSGPYFPDYAPEIDDDSAKALDLDSVDDATVLLIVRVAEPARDSTVNLQAPIVINRRSRQAVQVVLANGEHSVRHPLGAA